MFPNSAHPIHSGITNDLYHIQKAMHDSVVYISSLNLLFNYCEAFVFLLCQTPVPQSLYSDGQGLFIH